jgi:hyperosmotically inducible protein
MRRSISCLLLLSVLAIGCDDMDMNNVSLPDSDRADNSAVNQRDASGETKTPLDQGQNSADVERTAEIRRRVLDLDGVSINARNVKIISVNGQVTLRGPVDNEAEKDAIYKVAAEVAGEENIVNELEVPQPKTEPPATDKPITDDPMPE